MKMKKAIQEDKRMQRIPDDPYYGLSKRVSSSYAIPRGGSRTVGMDRCDYTAVPSGGPALWAWRKYAVFPSSGTGK